MVLLLVSLSGCCFKLLLCLKKYQTPNPCVHLLVNILVCISVSLLDFFPPFICASQINYEYDRRLSQSAILFSLNSSINFGSVSCARFLLHYFCSKALSPEVIFFSDTFQWLNMFRLF